MNINNDMPERDEKKRLHAVAPSAEAAEPLALMDCGEFSLLISSKDIVTLMSAQKILEPTPEAKLETTSEQPCGEIEFEMKKIPVFVFNKALQLQTSLSSQQLTLVVLQYQTQVFAIGCSSLEKIEMHDLQFFPVPINMCSRKQPFSQFAVINNRAAGLTSAQDLLRLLKTRGFVFPSNPVNQIQEAS